MFSFLNFHMFEISSEIPEVILICWWAVMSRNQANLALLEVWTCYLFKVQTNEYLNETSSQFSFTTINILNVIWYQSTWLGVLLTILAVLIGIVSALLFEIVNTSRAGETFSLLQKYSQSIPNVNLINFIHKPQHVCLTTIRIQWSNRWYNWLIDAIINFTWDSRVIHLCVEKGEAQTSVFDAVWSDLVLTRLSSQQMLFVGSYENPNTSSNIEERILNMLNIIQTSKMASKYHK